MFPNVAEFVLSPFVLSVVGRLVLVFLTYKTMVTGSILFQADGANIHFSIRVGLERLGSRTCRQRRM